MIYMRFQLYLYTWSLCPMIYMRFELYLYTQSLYSMIYMRFQLYAPDLILFIFLNKKNADFEKLCAPFC